MSRKSPVQTPPANVGSADAIEYKKLDEDRVLVIAHRPGQKPLKTIVHVVPPEELEVDAPVPTVA